MRLMNDQISQQFKIRLPADLKARLDAAAAEAGRSVTAEIVQRLEMSFELQQAIPSMVDNQMAAVESMKGMLKKLAFSSMTENATLIALFANDPSDAAQKILHSAQGMLENRVALLANLGVSFDDLPRNTRRLFEHLGYDPLNTDSGSGSEPVPQEPERAGKGSNKK